MRNRLILQTLMYRRSLKYLYFQKLNSNLSELLISIKRLYGILRRDYREEIIFKLRRENCKLLTPKDGVSREQK